MANTTVTTKVVVQFDNQFSEPAEQAVQNYKKSLEEVQKTGKVTEGIFESISRQQMEAILMNEKLASRGKDNIDKFMTGIEDDFLKKSDLDKIEKIGSFAAVAAIFKEATAALAGFYALWKTGQVLEEWRVGEKPIDEYAEGVKESLDILGNSQPLQLPSIPEDAKQTLESIKACLEQIQNMQDIFVTVNLVDNATEEAKRIRGEIEKTFSQDITQRVTIAEESFKTTSGPRSSDSFFDGGPEFQTSSLDLTGFSGKVETSSKIKVPGFSSGIDRVPRDMLAMIHKDESVLPIKEADNFRQGNSNGITIQNLNFSFNVPNGLKLDREEFRNLAFQMRDELKRLDRRMN